ncbi:MAG TPA: alpha/beta hydrolase, partial [Gemmatimonadales bacterium]
VRRVNAPALVIHGSADPLPLDGARDWAETLPNGKLVLLEGIGHFPYVEAPETFFPIVEEFLRGS